jgi:hypothetical protein
MPDRLDFDSARRVLEEVTPTDTWDDATRRAETGSLVQLDAEDATVSTVRRRPRRPRPPTIRVLGIAAGLVAVVALAAVLTSERQSVDTISPLGPPTTECPSPVQPRAITQGVQMNKRFAAPVAGAATAILLLGACSDDSESPGDTAEPDTTEVSTEDDGVVTEVPAEACDVISAEEVGAVVGDTITAAPGPRQSCTYTGEDSERLWPSIYFEEFSQFDFGPEGQRDPISVAGYEGYILDAGAAGIEGVLTVDSVVIRVVAASDDIPGDTPVVEDLLELAAGKL